MLRTTETRVVYKNRKEFLQPDSNRKKSCRSSEEERVENIMKQFSATGETLNSQNCHGSSCLPV